MPERFAYLPLEEGKWWSRRCGQNKARKIFQAFARQGRVCFLSAELLFFYEKHPTREVRGKAEFVERVTGDFEELWSKYGAEPVFESYKEYKFLAGREKTTSILFENLQEFTQPMPGKCFLEKIGDGSTLPRNGKYLSKELASMLV